MNRSWLEFGAIIGVAVYGAVANVLMRNLVDKRRGWDLFWFMLSNMVIAGFCGLMSLAISMSIQAKFTVSLMIAGMAGYMGGKFLEILEGQVRRKLGMAQCDPLAGLPLPPDPPSPPVPPVPPDSP